jgi:diguanylate cyclase
MMDSSLSIVQATDSRTHTQVLHLARDARLAYRFFVSFSHQLAGDFILTSSCHNPKRPSPLLKASLSRYDVIFIHADPDSGWPTELVAHLKQLAPEVAIIAITHKATDLDHLNPALPADIDDYIQLSELSSQVIVRVLRFALERQKNRALLQQTRENDYSTGLLTRNAFLTRLSRVCAQSALQAEAEWETESLQSANFHAVLAIELDQFHRILDEYGPRLADTYIATVAKRLQTSLRQDDLVARGGDDTFFVLLRQMKDFSILERIARNLLDTVAQTVILDEKCLFTTASLGISLSNNSLLQHCPTHDSKAEKLLHHARLALVRAKKNGGNQFQAYSRQLMVQQSITDQIAKGLHEAIANQSLYLVYQPQVDSQSDELLGAEVLLRWRHPEFGELSPALFVPVLENTGLISPATRFIITTAVSQWLSWQKAGIIKEQHRLSINISPHYLGDADFKKILSELAYLTPTQKNNIYFEITENLFLDHTLNRPHAEYVKDMGFKLAIDDFGTGFSSLAYLKHFPVDCLKLDCAFTKELVSNPIDFAITKAVIGLARDLNLTLIAEGVEDMGTLALLKHLGCRFIQGYYYAKPLSLGDFAALAQAPKIVPAAKAPAPKS